MRKIFKYEIALVDGLQRIKMPKNAKVLSFQNQTGTMQIWVLLNPDEKQQVVWHLFEVCYN